VTREAESWSAASLARPIAVGTDGAFPCSSRVSYTRSSRYGSDRIGLASEAALQVQPLG
jgi:hypothetical protein